ncbi:hypothetical protein ANME2D_00002 [Candidatus Methanoperedens nitroreducens]|uniref:Uncharacterized protein n=1 Tax=Candidatus Methanoperedens nitratireducens TaxID=1392998 RepID=A0A062VBA4_9EURY|nr:hypothetical protein ANME2D_00002 [Candidatus Methanoperedens nitroreducens]
MKTPSRTVFESFCDMAKMLGFKIERHPDKLIVFFNKNNEPNER